jgi:hypothetical protein
MVDASARQVHVLLRLGEIDLRPVIGPHAHLRDRRFRIERILRRQPYPRLANDRGSRMLARPDRQQRLALGVDPQVGDVADLRWTTLEPVREVDVERVAAVVLQVDRFGDLGERLPGRVPDQRRLAPTDRLVGLNDLLAVDIPPRRVIGIRNHDRMGRAARANDRCRTGRPGAQRVRMNAAEPALRFERPLHGSVSPSRADLRQHGGAQALASVMT